MGGLLEVEVDTRGVCNSSFFFEETFLMSFEFELAKQGKSFDNERISSLNT
jgi:hypothetical protein|tara:strand:+ start:726 stop:878 length:153 start_codon:yes stop_codon:yes gene_type:complete